MKGLSVYSRAYECINAMAFNQFVTSTYPYYLNEVSESAQLLTF